MGILVTAIILARSFHGAVIVDLEFSLVDEYTRQSSPDAGRTLGSAFLIGNLYVWATSPLRGMSEVPYSISDRLQRLSQ